VVGGRPQATSQYGSFGEPVIHDGVDAIMQAVHVYCQAKRGEVDIAGQIGRLYSSGVKLARPQVVVETGFSIRRQQVIRGPEWQSCQMLCGGITSGRASNKIAARWTQMGDADSKLGIQESGVGVLVGSSYG